MVDTEVRLEVEAILEGKPRAAYILAALAWWRATDPDYKWEWELLVAEDLRFTNIFGQAAFQVREGQTGPVEYMARASAATFDVFGDPDCSERIGYVRLL